MKATLLKRPWHWLARPGTLAVLIVALLAILFLGALLPQLPDAALEPARLAEWRALAQARYGSLAPLLEAAGAHRIYRTPLLWGLLALLGVATLACIVQRGRGTWRTAFSRPLRLPPAIFEAAPHTCAIAFPPGDDPAHLDSVARVARHALSRRDYRVRTAGDADVVWLRGDRCRLAPLANLAEHLAVLIILVGVGMSLIFGWREMLVIEPGGTAEIGHASALALRNDGFEISRYADGSPAAYVARLTIEDGPKTGRRAIGVNRPAAARGTRLYLQGYRPAGDAYAVTLLAVHDPGYGVVVGGGLAFLAAIVIALYCPRSSVHIRITSDGTLWLSGWAGHRAFDFDREFDELSADLRREADQARREPAGPDTE